MNLFSSQADAAIDLAADLLRQAVQLQTPQERRQQAELDRMIGHDEDKATLVEMTDQAFRTHTPARVADQLTHILDVQGVPRFFNPVEQAMLRGFQAFGEYLPGVAVPLMKEKMRRETANVILPAERELLAEHLRSRAEQGVRMNVNLLGEAILGEDEANRRTQQILDVLRMDEVTCVSVKISTLYSQVSPLARQHTISTVADRLETLYRTAAQEVDAASGKGKFVYLDMEEYRDLYLTADTLMHTLDRHGLANVCAGIALQAYVPDSYAVMRGLIDWSRQRVSAGGEPLTIRLVKGANMEMERVEASISGHAQAPYQVKQHTDANYKRMLRELIPAAAEGDVCVGVASHNLFDVALAMIWTRDFKASSGVQFEMLEGMANHQRRAISDQNVPMLLYAPACDRASFLNAIGYLIRRLDENTGQQNFLRHAYRLRPDTPEFEMLADDFRESVKLMESVSAAPRRDQVRWADPVQPPAANHWSHLINEPDTDWSVLQNSSWAGGIIERWQPRSDEQATVVELFVGNESVRGKEQRESIDPSRPGVVVCRYQTATLQQAKDAVAIAARDESGWRTASPQHRHQVLRQVAQNLRLRRADLIGAMIADGGKTISEADPEVSEAIDFCEFYPLTANDWYSSSVSVAPRGVVAVITPWNFPLAIPCGGVAAALSAGNTVILKPASETVLTASLLCQACWDAGVPRDALQLLPCESKVAEAGLVCNADVDAVILTGSTWTAKRMLEVRPGLHLLAETGGKNATVVTSMADRDLAIKHVVHSAFSHSGQKCSATSLLLLEDEVFADERFRESLADAVRSIHVGSAWELQTKMGPLIHPPGEELTRGLKTLEDDESWLVVPQHVVGNPNLYRPGVKWNIKPGGFAHLTELFGPVLGVMRYSRLEEAIEIVRSTGYGLTSGLESLDEREIELWRQSIGAGNLYINRPTTGAIVLRQPFGGVGLSAHGPGVKAGGPHYVLALMHVADGKSDQASAGSEADNEGLDLLRQRVEVGCVQGAIETPVAEELVAAMQSQRAAVADEFSREHDTLRLVGQDNLRRYRPVRSLTIRATARDRLRDVIIAVAGAVAVGGQTTLSIDPNMRKADKDLIESTADYVPGRIHPVEETDEELTERINDGGVSRLRLLSRADVESCLVTACAKNFVTIIDESVLLEGRIECLRYLDEQSISHDYHRYGNLGRRAVEQRRPVA